LDRNVRPIADRRPTRFSGPFSSKKTTRMGKLTGQTGIVTGAGRGIGRGIAKALAGEGCALVITSRTLEELVSVAAECEALGVSVVPFAADITLPDQVERLFEIASRKFGRLDLLVNNAGAFDGGPLDELSIEAWDKVIAVNLRAPFLCTRAALQIMKPQRSGRIINIGSISAQRVRPNSAPYSASKHGLWGLSQVTALEGREYGVTCCTLHPGNILVERREQSGKTEDDEPMLSVEEIAEVALLMATLPPHVEMLEAIVLPHKQLYVGRG
jgi:NAD(P)-dependent dehydrogenase (short-subunit alcohol dehydrogenase family)